MKGKKKVHMLTTAAILELDFEQPSLDYHGLMKLTKIMTRNCDEDVENMRTAYNQRRRFLMNAFKEMGLECFEPYGAFYVFPCIKEFGMTSEEFATRFLEEEKVAAVPGTAFGMSGEGYLRISYAYSIENLKVAIDRLKHFVEKLRKNS